MNNNTAIVVSAGMVLAVAAISGGVYMSAVQASSAAVEAPVPASNVVVEYVDLNGNIVPVDTIMGVTGDVPQPPAVSPGYTGEYDENEHEYEDGDDYSEADGYAQEDDDD